MSVTLHTSIGDVKLEIFCDTAPRTAFNFLALCANGSYDGTLFHRNIRGFMVRAESVVLLSAAEFYAANFRVIRILFSRSKGATQRKRRASKVANPYGGPHHFQMNFTRTTSMTRYGAG